MQFSSSCAVLGLVSISNLTAWFKKKGLVKSFCKLDTVERIR